MKPGENGNGRKPEGDGVGAGPMLGGGNGASVSATDLLVELGQCQRGIRGLLRTASATLGPMTSQTLPAVAFTLSGLIHATEMAANKVLDHAEGLAAERERLGKALGRLEPMLGGSQAGAKRAWQDVMECQQALAGRMMSIMSAMAFQDLTTQHLGSAIQSVEQVREQLLQMLVLLDIPVEAEEEPRPVVVEPAGVRQALADQLWAEMKDH
jgi:chemotaxis regulatin CheY-phosphate phosphatase CheZ